VIFFVTFSQGHQVLVIFFKSKYKIISNDFLKFLSDITKAKLLNDKMSDFKKFKK